MTVHNQLLITKKSKCKYPFIIIDQVQQDWCWQCLPRLPFTAHPFPNKPCATCTDHRESLDEETPTPQNFQIHLRISPFAFLNTHSYGNRALTIMISLAMYTPVQGNMATPLKSALKRTHSDMDDAHDDSSSSSQAHDPQRKRYKVQFNEADNKTEIFWNDKSQHLVKEEVRRAMERHIAGDSAAYDSLKEMLTTKPTAHDAPSPTLLKRYVIALIAHAHLLGKRCSGLVTAILDCSWLGRDDDFVVCYRRLLVNMISAHGGHAQVVMEALVDRFTNRKLAAVLLCVEHTHLTRGSASLTRSPL